MEQVKKVLSGHRGATPVYVVEASGKKLLAPETLFITGSNALVAELSEILGADNVKLVE